MQFSLCKCRRYGLVQRSISYDLYYKSELYMLMQLVQLVLSLYEIYNCSHPCSYVRLYLISTQCTVHGIQ